MRCPTRSPTRRSSTTSSSRPSTAGRCGHLRRRLPAARPAELTEAYDQAGPLDRRSGSTAPARPGQRPAPLPARQRQRLGQRHHLRPRTGHRDAPTWPRSSSCSCANWPTWPPSSDRPDRGRSWTATRRRDADRDARPAVGRRAVRRPRRQSPGGPGPASSLLDLMPIVLGEDLPAEHQRRAGRPDRDAPDRVRAGHRTARPRRTTLADGYWRGPIWAPVHRPHRGRPAPRRPRPSSPTRSAPASAPCARSPASPRTSTPRPAPACATAPTPGPPAPTSSSPPPTTGAATGRVRHSRRARLHDEGGLWLGLPGMWLVSCAGSIAGWCRCCRTKG